MKSLFDVLREKERQIEILRGEIEALQVAARILADENDDVPATPRPEPIPVAKVPVPPRPEPVSVTAVGPKKWP